MQESRPTVGNLKARDIAKVLGERWKCLDDATKAKYKEECDRDMVIPPISYLATPLSTRTVFIQIKYKQEIEAFKSKITDEQAKQRNIELASLKSSEEVKHERKERKEAQEELGKPKPSLSGYFLFMQGLREKSPTKLSATEISAKWKSLKDAERQVYLSEAAKSREKYK